MKNVSSKSLILAVIFITFIVSFYLIQAGKVSFLPIKQTAAPISFLSEILYREKEYRLDYKNISQSSIVEVARFERNEGWRGDGFFDDRVFKEGKSSLVLNSRNHEQSVAILDKKLDLKNTTTFKFLVNVETDPWFIEAFNLILTNKTLGQSYQFSFHNLKNGWNFLILPKEEFVSSSETDVGWDNIDEIKFEHASRPKTKSTINLDFLWSEADVDYTKDWDINNPILLSLGENNGDVGVLVIASGRELAVIKEITSARDYIFQAKLTPQGQGKFGLFLRGDYKNGYGYYFVMDGVGKSSWQIFKVGVFDNKLQTLALANGGIEGFRVEQNHPYWLKTRVNGFNLTFDFSLNGKDFIRLGQVSDKSFQKGKLGIVAEEQMLLVDEVAFFQ